MRREIPQKVDAQPISPDYVQGFAQARTALRRRTRSVAVFGCIATVSVLASAVPMEPAMATVSFSKRQLLKQLIDPEPEQKGTVFTSKSAQFENQWRVETLSATRAVQLPQRSVKQVHPTNAALNLNGEEYLTAPEFERRLLPGELSKAEVHDAHLAPVPSISKTASFSQLPPIRVSSVEFIPQEVVQAELAKATMLPHRHEAKSEPLLLSATVMPAIELTESLIKSTGVALMPQESEAGAEGLTSLNDKYQATPEMVASLEGLQNPQEVAADSGLSLPGSLPLAPVAGPLQKTDVEQSSVSPEKQQKTVAIAPRLQPAKPRPMQSPIALTLPFPKIPDLDLPPLTEADQFLPLGGSQQMGFVWPAKGILTSGYGWRWGRMHRGIDIAAPVGTTVVASADGVVVTAGWNSGGYGKLVEIRHPDGTLTLYAHNNRINTKMGQIVRRGEKIAEMGSTGRSTGPHTHFEIHPPGQGAVNPMTLLTKG